MTDRDALIEAVKQRLWETGMYRFPDQFSYGERNKETDKRLADDAESILSAIKAMGCVIVPSVLTGEMTGAVKDCPMLNGYESVGQITLAWPLLLAISPYARKET